MVLLNGWILPSGGAASGRVCPAACKLVLEVFLKELNSLETTGHQIRGKLMFSKHSNVAKLSRSPTFSEARLLAPPWPVAILVTLWRSSHFWPHGRIHCQGYLGRRSCSLLHDAFEPTTNRHDSMTA